MSRLPALGPRGEGWVAIQVVLFGLIAWLGLRGPGGAPTLAVAGWAAVAVGGALAAAAVVGLGRASALAATPHPAPGARFVASGPYRFVRHPIYAGLVLAALGWAAARGSVETALAAIVLLGFFDLKRRREEAWLVERYDDYEAYRRRVRALVPGLY